MIIHLLRGDKNADVDQFDVFEIVFIWYEPIKDVSTAIKTWWKMQGQVEENSTF